MLAPVVRHVLFFDEFIPILCYACPINTTSPPTDKRSNERFFMFSAQKQKTIVGPTNLNHLKTNKTRGPGGPVQLGPSGPLLRKDHFMQNFLYANVHQFKNNISKYIRILENDKTLHGVIVQRNGKPVCAFGLLERDYENKQN